MPGTNLRKSLEYIRFIIQRGVSWIWSVTIVEVGNSARVEIIGVVIEAVVVAGIIEVVLVVAEELIVASTVVALLLPNAEALSVTPWHSYWFVPHITEQLCPAPQGFGAHAFSCRKWCILHFTKFASSPVITNFTVFLCNRETFWVKFYFLLWMIFQFVFLRFRYFISSGC